MPMLDSPTSIQIPQTERFSAKISLLEISQTKTFLVDITLIKSIVKSPLAI